MYFYYRRKVIQKHCGVQSQLVSDMPPLGNPEKFCHNLSRCWCYMLTFRALTSTEDPENELVDPFVTMSQEPWHPKRARRNAKPVPWSSSHTGKCAPLQAEKQPEQWREKKKIIFKAFFFKSISKKYCFLAPGGNKIIAYVIPTGPSMLVK